VALHVPVSPATLLLPAATVGVTDGAKKPEGYVSVMVPPAGTGFAALNPSVTDTDVARSFCDRLPKRSMKYELATGRTNASKCKAADGSKSGGLLSDNHSPNNHATPLVHGKTLHDDDVSKRRDRGSSRGDNCPQKLQSLCRKLQ
jgi:hypothetical protein